MTAKLTVIAALAVIVATLTAIAAAGSVGARQRVQIQVKDSGSGDRFVLTVLGVRSHQSRLRHRELLLLDHDLHHAQRAEDPGQQPWEMTLTGKRGTLVARNRIEWFDLPDGWAVSTGTWRVIRGTGDYAGLSGGGVGAGVSAANGSGRSQFEGFLSAR
jgi:hypothetical protein